MLCVRIFDAVFCDLRCKYSLNNDIIRAFREKRYLCSMKSSKTKYYAKKHEGHNSHNAYGGVDWRRRMYETR